MRSRDFLGLALGLILVGAGAATADAAPVTTDLEATPALKDPLYYGGSAGHAFWLPPLTTSSADEKMVFGIPDGTASFQVTIDTDDPTNNHILFVGSLVAAADSSLTFDFVFEFHGPAAGIGPGYDGKRELFSSAYTENGGPVDTDTWTYFDLTSGKLFGTGAMAGAELTFFQVPVDGHYPFQLGVGANGKNVEPGFSGWLGWTVDSQATDWRHWRSSPLELYGSGSGHGDINITLDGLPNTTTQIVPEPGTFALFGLGLAGLGLTLGRRRRRRQADAAAKAATTV